MKISASKAPYLLIFAILWFCYFFSPLFFDWVGLDDLELIKNNLSIQNNNFYDLLTSVQIAHFHPLTNLWLWFCYKSLGLVGIKLGNVLLHSLNVILFVLVATKFFRAQTAMAAVAAILWTFHPMSAEVIYWATGPKELLGTFATLLALYFFTTERQAKFWRIILWIGFSCLAILSKSTWVILLPLFIFFSIHPKRPPRSMHPMIIPGLILIALCAGVATTMTLLGHKTLMLHADLAHVLQQPFLSGQSTGVTPSVDHLLTSALFYFGRWLLPYNLTPFFDADYTVWQIGDLVGTFILLSLIMLRFKHDSTFNWRVLFVIFLPLIPVLGIIPFGYKQAQACRYIYFSLPFLLLFSFETISLFLTTAPRTLVAKSGLAILATTLFIFGLFYRSTYQNQETFYHRILEIQPRSSIGLNGLALAYINKGDLENAEAYLKLSLASDPDYLQPNLNLGIFYLKQKRCSQAMPFLKRAHDLNPNFEQTNRAISACK